MSKILEPGSISRLFAMVDIMNFLSEMKALEGAEIVLSERGGPGRSVRTVSGARERVTVTIEVEVIE